MDKGRIESILRVNGLTPSAKDEEIKSVLLSARYSEDEVDTAIMVIRENVKTSEQRVDGLHKVFRSDQGLKAKEISDLLGIDIELTDYVASASAQSDSNFFQLFLWFTSLLLALIALLLYMYVTRIGFFHPSSVIHLTFL